MGVCGARDIGCLRNQKTRTSYGKLIARSSAQDEGKKDKDAGFGCFDRFDKNHDGFLDQAEIVEMLKHAYLLTSRDSLNLPAAFFKKEADSLIEKAEQSHSGQISRQDFYRLYN